MRRFYGFYTLTARLLLWTVLLSGLHVGVAAEPRQTQHQAEPRQTQHQAEPRQTQHQAEPRLILAFGDSLTAGLGLPHNESYPAQLEKQLQMRGWMVRLHNAGVSGDTTAAARARLAWVLKALPMPPALAIVCLGGNDSLRGLDPATTRANLTAIMDILAQRRIPVVLVGMRAPPNLGRVYQQAYDPLFQSIARTYKAYYYPFLLEGVITQPGLMQADGLHPNARGTRVIVRHLQPVVEAALNRR